MNQEGSWSQAEGRTVHIGEEVNSPIVNGEYFFDADPGIGNGQPLPAFSPNDTVSAQLTISTASVNPGVHALFFRFQNQAGQWSISESRTVFIRNDFHLPIVDAEYFWDSDPGIGLGVNLPVSALGDSGLIDQGIVVPPLSLGIHTFNIRAKSLDGTWSLFETKDVNLCTTYGPISRFEVLQYGNLVTLENISEYADSSYWDMGDGTIDTATNPNHFYNGSGVYEISLFTFNPCGVDTSTQEITIGGMKAVFPPTAGKDGIITGRVHGFSFTEDSLRLAFIKSDSNAFVLIPDTVIYLNEQNLYFYLDLNEAIIGEYDVVYYLNEVPFMTLEKGFIVEETIEPELEVYVTGPGFLRAGRFGDFHIVVENKGNVNAIMVPVTVYGLPINGSVMVEEFSLLDPKLIPFYNDGRDAFIQDGGDSIWFDRAVMDIPKDSSGDGGYRELFFVLTHLPPGVHTFRYSALVSIPDTTVKMTAFALPPILTYTSLTEMRDDSTISVSDCIKSLIKFGISLVETLASTNTKEIGDCIKGF